MATHPRASGAAIQKVRLPPVSATGKTPSNKPQSKYAGVDLKHGGMTPSASRGWVIARVELERRGVPSKRVSELRDSLGTSIATFGEVLGIPEATYKKKVKQGDVFQGSAGIAVLEVDDILDTALNLVPKERRKAFDVGDWFGKWMLIPQPSLGGRPAAEFLDTPTGRGLVKRLVGAMGSGAYL